MSTSFHLSFCSICIRTWVVVLFSWQTNCLSFCLCRSCTCIPYILIHLERFRMDKQSTNFSCVLFVWSSPYPFCSYGTHTHMYIYIYVHGHKDMHSLANRLTLSLYFSLISARLNIEWFMRKLSSMCHTRRKKIVACKTSWNITIMQWHKSK
jgi:hypothetical protein